MSMVVLEKEGGCMGQLFAVRQMRDKFSAKGWDVFEGVD